MDSVTNYILQELAFDGDLGKFHSVAGSSPPLVELSGSITYRLQCVQVTETHIPILHDPQLFALANCR